MQVCVCVCVGACVCACVRACMCVCMHACMCACVYVRIKKKYLFAYMYIQM